MRSSSACAAKAICRRCWMSNPSKGARRFDLYLMNVLAADLKRMAGLWVNAGRLCKADCAEAVCAGLADPKRVAAALAKLKPPHRTALAFVKEAGGELAPDCLEAAMVAAGHTPHGLRRYSYRSCWRHGGYPRMRHALLTALRALPAKPSGFFTLDRFDEALFDRVGEHVSSDSHTPSPPYTLRATEDELQRKMKEWRRNLRSKWCSRERPWIENALTTWLYWLGIVELSIECDTVRGFRLTDLGREFFHGAMHGQPRKKRKGGSTGAWIVQPDFGLMVYIE